MTWAERNNYGRENVSQEFSRRKRSSQGFLEKINFFFRKEKAKEFQEIEFYRRAAQKDRENPRLHLKLAELYRKRAENKKATAEYLLAAEIFGENGLLPQALAIYKKVLKENPFLEPVNWKIAKVYQQMGFLGEAFRHYNQLLNQYELLGIKEKAEEVMALMVNLDPQKFMLNSSDKKISSGAEGFEKKEKLEGEENSFFDLNAALQDNEQIELNSGCRVEVGNDFGFRQIINELRKNAEENKMLPNFNYHLGVACWEMGFVDEAIAHLREALLKEENVLETAILLGKCYKEKGWWQEARESLERALQSRGVPPEKEEELRRELELVKGELVREKQIMGILNMNCSPESKALPKKKSFDYWGGGLKVQEAVTA